MTKVLVGQNYMGDGPNVLWELQPRLESDAGFHCGASIEVQTCDFGSVISSKHAPTQCFREELCSAWPARPARAAGVRRRCTRRGALSCPNC